MNRHATRSGVYGAVVDASSMTGIQFKLTRLYRLAHFAVPPPTLGRRPVLASSGLQLAPVLVVAYAIALRADQRLPESALNGRKACSSFIYGSTVFKLGSMFMYVALHHSPLPCLHTHLKFALRSAAFRISYPHILRSLIPQRLS